ncbi:MAG: hypothetical protein IPI65_00100 [Bacteroidetes bacterium]|nr:hypothetical protein [Bacteroidota bacterium]
MQLKFEELALIFEKNNFEYMFYKSHPLRYLRNYGITIIGYITNDVDKNNTKKYVRQTGNILKHEPIFNRCTWCKVISLTVIYAICGKARLTIDVFWGLSEGIQEAVQNLFNNSNNLTNIINEFFTSFSKFLSPYEFAKLLCAQLGYCQF